MRKTILTHEGKHIVVKNIKTKKPASKALKYEKTGFKLPNTLPRQKRLTKAVNGFYGKYIATVRIKKIIWLINGLFLSSLIFLAVYNFCIELGEPTALFLAMMFTFSQYERVFKYSKI